MAPSASEPCNDSLDAWRVIDEEIGRVMEVADNIALVSDHGSGPMCHFSNVIPALEEIDAFRHRGVPWSRSSSVLSRLTHGVPSGWLRTGERLVPPKLRDAALDRLRPMGEWLPGAAEKFRLQVDWSSTVIPLNQGLIFRNPSPDPKSPTTADIAEAMTAVPGVRRVWRREEIYSGPHLAAAPALWLEAEPEVELVARMNEDWETKPPEKGREWIVNHRQDGIYAFHGEDIEPADLGPASLYDMFPTILSFYGIPLPRGLDGTPLPVARTPAPSPLHKSPSEGVA